MLSKLRAPLLFFWLGTPIACYMPLVFSPPKEPPTGAFIFLMGPFLVLGMYVVGFAFSFVAGLLFSSIGDLYQRYTGRGVSMLLGGVLGAFSGAVFNYLAFGVAGRGLINAAYAALAGGLLAWSVARSTPTNAMADLYLFGAMRPLGIGRTLQPRPNLVSSCA